MTDRLRHSPDGFIRSLQISQAVVFVFVEGPTDRFFYSEIAQLVCGARLVKYEVILARELPVATGGKNGLLACFDLLTARNDLMGAFSGKRWVCAFHLDKDIDDLTGVMRRSPHVIYTEHYHLENYFFLEGDITRVLHVAGKLPTETARSISHAGWQADAASLLKEWVILCVASVLSDAPCGINYRSFSRIHTGPPWRCDANAFAIQKDILRNALTPDRFDAVWGKAERVVNDLYSNGRKDAVFKGRWYANYLLTEIKAADPDARDVSLDALIAGAQQTLNFDGTWVHQLRQALADLVDAALT